jgi:hypothetical protein
MRITIEIPDQEMAAIKQLTQSDDDAAAVVMAAREFLRLTRLRELKSAYGKVEFESNWDKLEELELNEFSVPPS